VTLKGGTRWVKFFSRISLITLVPFDQIRQDNTYRTGAYFQESATPYTQGGGAPTPLPNFGGSLLFMHIYFDAKLPNFPNGAGSRQSPILGVPFYLCVHSLSQSHAVPNLTWGMGLVYRGQPPQGAGSKRSPVSGAILCVHPLSQNYQICRGYTYGGWAYILGSATPPRPSKVPIPMPTQFD